MFFDVADAETETLLRRYASLLNLPTAQLRVTTRRQDFERFLGRRISSGAGGAYVYLPRTHEHLILINLDRIDRDQPRAVEIVVAEELIHCRDWMDGDRRRHAKHGYDRIAYRVAALTGASLDEIRGALRPARHRAARYLYECPGCGRRVARRLRGTWSCGQCAPTFDQAYVLRLVAQRTSPVLAAAADSLAGSGKEWVND